MQIQPAPPMQAQMITGLRGIRGLRSQRPPQGGMYEDSAWGPNPTGLPEGFMQQIPGYVIPTDEKPAMTPFNINRGRMPTPPRRGRQQPDSEHMLTAALQKALIKRMSPASRRLLATRSMMQRREF